MSRRLERPRAERPSTGRIVFVGGYLEPTENLESAIGRMHLPSEQTIEPVAYRDGMTDPEKLARQLEGASLLTNSAGTSAVERARAVNGKPLGLSEAVFVDGAEEKGYLRLIGGFSLLLTQQLRSATHAPDKQQAHIDMDLVTGKLREFRHHPIKDLRYLRAIHHTSTLALATTIAEESDIPVIAAYMPGDPFGFEAPGEEAIQTFIAAGGVPLELPQLGHESLLGPNPDETLRLVYSHLPWTLAAQQ